MRSLALALCAAFAVTTLAREAAAAPPWVERPLTLPAGDVAFDLGLGTDDIWPSGAGINLEMGVGLTSRIELGVRTGVRFGDILERDNQPDAYGRLFDLQTFDEGNGVMANPEVRLRGALVRGEVGEVALEGRVVLPFDPADPAPGGVFRGRPRALGLMFGVPVALHLGDRVRLDTGAYVPVLVGLHGGVFTAVSIPFDVWIQATSRFWIGPITDLEFDDNGGSNFALGVGLGYQITRAIDFKAMALFPDVNRDFRDGIVAVGAGVQIRIE